MSDCEIVMVRGVDDANGHLCGGMSIAECCDCGASLCELHADECDLCRETYCSICLVFHMDQPHAKPNAGVNQDDESEQRRA
jgi:hypothetical protein